MKVKKIKNLNCIIDSDLVVGHIVSGYGESDMVSSEAANDKVTQKSDAKGAIFTVINEKNNGNLTFTLDELSDTVPIMDDHLDQGVGMEIIRDMPNGERYKYTDCFVMKEPSKSTTIENDEYEYELVYGTRTRV